MGSSPEPEQVLPVSLESHNFLGAAGLEGGRKVRNMRVGLGVVLAALASLAALPAEAQRFESLDNPRFVPAAEASFLRDADRVVGVARNGVAKAYPVPVLTWHHIVHDRLGDLPILATW